MTAKEFSSPLRFLAHLLSYVFHPLFISSYVMGYLIFIHPYAFIDDTPKAHTLRFVNIVLCNALFPAFSVFLLWRLKFIHSIMLRTVKERIIPYIIAMVFYWWTWRLSIYLGYAGFAVNFLLGAFLATCGAFFCNIYFKISMHMVAIGGAVMFFFQMSFNDAWSSGLYLSLALLIAGLVGTARLIVSDHSRFDIWSGLFIGILAQYIAWHWPF